MKKLYLLAGNGSASDWWDDVLPHFEAHLPQTIELPGFGDNTEPLPDSLQALSLALEKQLEPGHAILASGINALPVLHLLVRRPGFFSRVVLLSPVGVLLWKRRLPRLMAVPGVLALVHTLLSRYPKLFHRQYAAAGFSPNYQRIASGYRRCRAFQAYFGWVQPDSALTLFEQINDPIELVWGANDKVVSPAHAAAWEAVLCRANLTVTLQPGWGHYPFWQQPAAFVQWLEQGPPGFAAHTKAGRLQLARHAGLPVPALISIQHANDPNLTAFLQTDAPHGWAVRSSGDDEDGIDIANAGRHQTFLRVASRDVTAKSTDILASGVRTVAVQAMIEPVLSGVAFVRPLAAHIEWVEGHLAALVDGTASPHTMLLSRIGGAWGQHAKILNQVGPDPRRLWDFLQSIVATFHQAHLDIEWAWDGQQFWMLQARPVTIYPWQRWLTSANIDEILPESPSQWMEMAQRGAAASIPQVYARWDTRVLNDNEPFTAIFNDASYINSDLFLARMADWGMDGQQYAREIGGSTPAMPKRPWRWLASLPVFIRMLFASRLAINQLDSGLAQWQAELQKLEDQHASNKQFARWWLRFYCWLVQQNLCIGVALASSGGDALGKPATVYQNLTSSPHRLPWETDPATPRPNHPTPRLHALVTWPWPVRLAHRLGLPGMRGYYSQVREHFRDQLMRIFFQLHHAIPERSLFAPVASARKRRGSFWQTGSAERGQSASLLIYPGEAEGILGKDILLVDSLDPGQHQYYRQASAIIARSGGILSHGSTLLRELKIPSAILPDINTEWLGKKVSLRDGKVQRLE
jgi:pimeloyl-ACP methyl ester carboxylesterase